MLIVEGPDGAGKTTLISYLMQTFNLPLAPRVVSKEAKAMVDLVKWTENNLNEGFQFTIYDRHRLISEPIYGAILRDKFEPGFDDPEWMHEMMFRLYTIVKPIIIYCMPPYPIVYGNIKDDRDNLVVSPHIRKIWSLYLTKSVTDVATYDRAMFYDYTKPHLFAKVFTETAHILKKEGHDTLRRVAPQD